MTADKYVKVILLYGDFCQEEHAETFNTHHPKEFPITICVDKLLGKFKQMGSVSEKTHNRLS
jgi:hypothetical protein